MKHTEMPSYVGGDDPSDPPPPPIPGPSSGTTVRLLDRERRGPGLLELLVSADVGFVIAIRDVVYVHVSTDDDGVWQFVPLNPN